GPWCHGSGPRAGGVEPLGVFLQAGDRPLVFAHGLDRLDGGPEFGDRGDHRGADRGGGGADLVAVPAGVAAGGGVEDHVDPALGDQVGDRRVVLLGALADLADHGGGDAVAAQDLGGAAGGDDLEAQVGQVLDRQHDRALVPVGHRDEDPAAGGQRGVRGGLALGEGGVEVLVDAHHLAGGAHFRAEQRVDDAPFGGAEPGEGQHGLLDRDRAVGRQQGAVAAGRQQVVHAAQLGDGDSGADQGRGLGQLDAGGLGDERDGARGPRVGLDDVEHVGGQGELDVDQPAHAHALRDGQGGLGDACLHVRAQGDGRQHAGGVAGVDAGLLDVLHDAADVEVGAVVEGVDVDLDGVLEEPVHQHRVVLGDLGRVGDVAFQVGLVVDDLHAPAAQHVGGADQDRVADLVGDLLRVLEGDGG